MSAASEKRAVQEAAKAELRELLPVGTTVRTILRHVSSSGMSRRISLAISTPNGGIRDITHLAATATGDRLYAGDGPWQIVVGGAGMDMGFHLVYGLSRTLYSEGHKCTGSNGVTPSGKRSSVPRCPSNDHSNDYGMLTREWNAQNPARVIVMNDLGTSQSVVSHIVAERQEWIAAQPTYTRTRMHTDGGYALNQAWL